MPHAASWSGKTAHVSQARYESYQAERRLAQVLLISSHGLSRNAYEFLHDLLGHVARAAGKHRKTIGQHGEVELMALMLSSISSLLALA